MLSIKFNDVVVSQVVGNRAKISSGPSVAGDGTGIGTTIPIISVLWCTLYFHCL